MRKCLWLLVPLLSLTACSGTTETTSTGSVAVSNAAADSPNEGDSTHSDDATATAERIDTKVRSVTDVVTITEDNDPNDLIGRPDGYFSAAVIYDDGASCDEISSSCGATVETWPDEASAKARQKYISGILKEMPMLGQEYHALKGSTLLRIAGTIKPSAADQYAEAFESEIIS